MVTGIERRRNRPPEVHNTPEEWGHIDRAVTESGTDLTIVVVENPAVARCRGPADRSEFTLSLDAQLAWDEINRRPARILPKLSEFMRRPSPFVD